MMTATMAGSKPLFYLAQPKHLHTQAPGHRTAAGGHGNVPIVGRPKEEQHWEAALSGTQVTTIYNKDYKK